MRENIARWNVQDGLFHFLFANEDRYILDSMVCVNLTDYLRHMLSEKHMEKILFVEGAQGSFAVRVFNQTLWQWCADQFRGPLGLGLKGGQTFQPAPEGCRIPCTAEQIRKLPVQAEHTVFVFALETFAELYRAREGELRQLVQNNGSRKNLIILRTGVTAEASQKILSDPGGIFQSTSGENALFPAVVNAFQNADLADEGCYELLRRSLAGRYVFLNRFSKEAVARIVRYTAWFERKDEDGLTDAEIDRISEFVWRWFHDADMQAEKSGMFSENDLCSYQLLAGDLSRFWTTIADTAAETDLQKPVIRPIKDTGVVSDGMLVRCLPDTRYTWPNDPKRQLAYRTVTARLRRTLRKPRAVRPDKNAEEHLRRFIDQMKIAMKKGDTATVSRIETCMNDVIRRKFACGGQSKIYWEYHDILIAESERVFEMEQSIRIDEQRRRQMQSQRDACISRVKELPAGSSECLHLQESAVSLHKEIETYTLLINRKRQDSLAARDRIVKLEQQEELLRHQSSAETARQAEKILAALTEQIREERAKQELLPPEIEAETSAGETEQPLQMPDLEEDTDHSREVMKNLMEQMI
ncbi:MAG: hypothetical protein IJI10_09530 [Eubacterium sp.]|nr:hypothetical protein [Eubacterium sp.]